MYGLILRRNKKTFLIMHFVLFPFYSFIYSLYILLDAHLYTLYFITLARCLNNEHENNQEIQLKFNFERMSYTNENDSEEDMDDETLPL